MSNPLRIKNRDQENAFRVPNKDENAQPPTKRSALQPKSNKRQRVPLGGKDPNGAPLLQRSNTSVQKPLRPSSAPLLKQPFLTKSNSTLGFAHANAPTTQRGHSGLTRGQIQNADPLKNDLFSGKLAKRETELVPQLVSDSPRKPVAKELPPLGTKLSDTFSEATQQLHASNLPQQTEADVDPIKGLKFNTRLIDQLAEEPVDTIPEVKPLQDVDDALTEDDLHFIKTGNRVSITENKNLQSQLHKEHGHLGLSKDELDDLLDF
ncbi:uncharacterized protein CXQ87_003392 [Candidozyma duobushaemuli]|uniref:Uncharacterized protein n=2 Tax=Candidozyma TaxID=3303203 RepID=A0ABX8I663_9ASCO|nr:uncharacterized protein CXQ87_003392 [[Candida] duobushaemulonis]PVH15550.1 hypothetical protein CXQ87_003392 [[Candida] duobushaemulonis]QWU88755.1 hypothetical protein CA3LBN_003063 [[Candida] haemuloni]